jgi:hypothetical protein
MEEHGSLKGFIEGFVDGDSIANDFPHPRAIRQPRAFSLLKFRIKLLNCISRDWFPFSPAAGLGGCAYRRYFVRH